MCRADLEVASENDLIFVIIHIDTNWNLFTGPLFLMR